MIQPIRYFALLSLFMPFALAAQDGPSTSGTQPPPKCNWEVSCEIGGDVLSIFAEPNWQPLYSLRAGLAKRAGATEVVSFGACVEYHRYIIGAGAPDFITHLSSRAVKRHDIDAYADIVFYHHYVIEIGASYVKSDGVDLIDGGQNMGLWKYGGLSRVSVHLAVGWRTDITLLRNVAFRIGTCYLLPTYGSARVLLVRTGLVATVR